MSHGQHNSAHAYHGAGVGRGPRLKSKLGRAITLKRLNALLKGGAMNTDKQPEGEQPGEQQGGNPTPPPADEKQS